MTNPNISDSYQDAFLSNISYGRDKDGNLINFTKNAEVTDTDTYQKYTVIAVSSPSNSGYQAYAFKDKATGKIIIAHRGTEPSSLKDLIADAGIGLDVASPQFSEALAFTNSVVAELRQTDPNFSASQIHQTGHSLGGGIAQLVAVANGSTATTFNAPIVSHLINDLKDQNPSSFKYDTSDLSVFKNNITEIAESDDLVHNVPPFGQHLGNVIEVNADYNKDDSFIEKALASMPHAYLVNEVVDKLDAHKIGYLAELALSQQNGNSTSLVDYKNAYNAIFDPIANTESKITFACQLDENDNLTIKLSGGSAFENSSLADFLENVGTNLVQEIGESLSNAIKQGGGTWVDQFTIAKPILVIGIGFDYLYTLQEEQRLHGDQGLRDNLVAAGQTLAGFLFGGSAAALAIPATAGVVATLAAGLAVGVMTDELFDLKIFDDGQSSAKDKLGDMIREFDLDQFRDDLHVVTEFGIDSAKDLLNETISTTQSISSFIQSSFDSLFTAESITSPPPVQRRVDPLTLDLDGDGVELINVNNSKAFFDLDVTPELDSNGNPTGNYLSDGVKEQVGWINSDDGLLTLDKNDNGTIDNILELFGRERRRFISGKTHRVLSECGKRSKATHSQVRVVFEPNLFGEKSDEVCFKSEQFFQ